MWMEFTRHRVYYNQSGEEQGSGSIDLRLKEIEADPYSVGVGREVGGESGSSRSFPRVL